jgi:hypothetical protein
MQVKDQFRKNQLSQLPGGSVVTVYYENKSKLEYDKIKSPKHYVETLMVLAKARGDFDNILLIEDSEGNNWYTKKKVMAINLGRLIRKENLSWMIKDLTNDIGELMIDPSKGPLLDDAKEGDLYEFYVNAIAIGRDEFTVTDIDVAVLKRRIS